MAREKVPELHRAFDTFTEVCDEHRTLLVTKAREYATATDRDFEDMFTGEPLYLLLDYSSALKEVLADVDSTYTSIPIIWTKL
jgi:hypothetical protein